MPVMKGSERYNCQVLCMNRKIVMIRPKMWLANDGHYRELRWFTAWKQKDHFDDFVLPTHLSRALSQTTVPFGYGYIQFLDTAIAGEVCEELFSPIAPHTELALNGVEVFMNCSGSHHELGKVDDRLGAIIGATRNRGGVYMYSNQQGCDGGRLYYDGCSCIVVNGDVVAQCSQFSLKDAELVVAQVDLDAVASLRGSISSFQEQASCKPKVSSVSLPYKLCQSFNLRMPLSTPLKVFLYIRPRESPYCIFQRYRNQKLLNHQNFITITAVPVPKRVHAGIAVPISGGSGSFNMRFWFRFQEPLSLYGSGGADSSSVAAIVGFMCQTVVKEIANGNEQVKVDATRIGGYTQGQFPTDSKQFARRIFYTVFMGSQNSSSGTRSRAKVLAEEIGTWHLDVSIDGLVSALLTSFLSLTGKLPRYKVDGGSNIENLALQNIQARIRMVMAFMLASLLPWVHNKRGFYLVLGTTNVDEGLRGHLTKYDCSSADINPIGSINKQDLRRFLKWAAVHLGFSSLLEVEAAPPTAELEPIRPNYRQLDEVDLGMTYEELSVYGRLRKIFRCGPVSMFKNLCYKWGTNLTPAEIAEKVKHFFKYYSINRHKMTVLTPSYHAQSYSAEDNRFDQRQFLYNPRWPYQFQKIDELVEQFSTDDRETNITKSCDEEIAVVTSNGGF
ncbi:hypothetical protein BUALT_Bualt04G0026100 [Buddleja alternifolia]|uniref:Glutamine-dependent NAD(+) synthetase n=1 Tax=Buddleja alternifolia TaxID=168488 RepID=A0AAV6XWM3_9LAMI|nr:hypothetical protein BUALT_Bualt04G0026100 [Buddleja alternifolia]